MSKARAFALVTAAASLGLWLSACGPSDSGAGRDAGGDPDGGLLAPDLAGGSWDLQNVSQTPETMGFHARQAMLADGARQVGWAETDAENLSDSDVYAAELSGGAWSASPLTDDDQQQTYTTMVTDGERIYLAWSGRADSQSDHDIYFALYADGDWNEASDLTSGFEQSSARRDYRPRMSLGSDGELVIAYLSNPLSDTGMVDGPEDVRVLRVRGGDVVGPETVIPSSEAVCSEVVLAVDPGGSTHIVGSCGSLRYAHDEGGSWTSSPLGLSRGETRLSPEIAADDAGVHLVYRGDIACADSTCGEIFYARRTQGGGFGRSINVSSTEAVSDILPVIAIDRWGRILIAYKELGGDDDDNALFSFSEGDARFSSPVNIAPESPDTDEEPTHITFDPETGQPSMMLLRLFSGSDPLNIDVFVADYSPGVGSAM